KKCIVLLSTYNGASYLKEQLDSILSQENISVRIIVRDDGSSDNTLDILHDYRKNFPDNFEIIQGENIGWQKSFFYLITYASANYHEASYFSFADQDDIWLPEKLAAGVSSLEQYESIPALYCSNLFYYKDGVNSGPTIKRKPIITYKSALCRNYATGCTVVFNRSLLEIVSRAIPEMNVAHDLWCYSIAVLCGKVVFDSTPHILYRQHSSNQIGNKRSILDIWKRRFSHFFHPDFINLRLRLARELIEKTGRYMNPEALEATRKIAEYKDSMRGRLSLFFDNGYTFGNPVNDLFIKGRILTGKL
ncbi:MAG: glycosyltransferase family 2 protein, partial [Muribaculaceae bacterium]|nr:glycosyltransferase family 2 protein [Muribaculaceae bacterium]